MIFTKAQYDASLRLMCSAPSFQRWIGYKLSDEVARSGNVAAALIAAQCRANRVHADFERTQQ